MTLPNFNNGEVFTNHPNDKNFAYAGDIPLVTVGATKTRVAPSDVPVMLYLSGYDNKRVINELDPRPADGVLIKVSELNEPRKCSKEGVKKSCQYIADWRYQYDPGQPITGKLLYSDDPDIKEYLRTPIASDDLTFFNITNYQEKPSTTLLVIRKNIIRKYTNIYECHFYYGIVDPVDEPANTSELVTVDFVFSPIFNKIDKLYMWGWYVRILQDGTNELLTKAQVRSLVYGS